MVLIDFSWFKSFLYFLLGFFIGRITMALQYAFFKEITRSKRKDTDNENNVFK